MNELNNALFADLIESTFRKYLTIRNPLNIIEMLEQCSKLPAKAQEYFDKLKIKEKSFNHKSSRKISDVVSNVLKNETIFMQRFEFLLNEIKDLNPHYLSIAKSQSISLIELCIKNGLDINKETGDTYLLKHALENKNNIMSNYLYGLPHVDKFKIDNNGNNLAHLASIGKNHSIINDLVKEHIDLFYVKNNANKTAIDIIFNYKQYDTLTKKNKAQIKESILRVINLHHTQEKLLSSETFEIINKSAIFKNVLIEANHDKLGQLLSYKDESNIAKKVNKI